MIRAPFCFGTKVPFAGDSSCITRFTERFGHSDRIKRKPQAIRRRCYAKAAPVATCHEACSCRTADRGNIMLPELNPFIEELAEIGGRNVAAMETNVGPTKVICDDENDVWLGRGVVFFLAA